MSSNIVDYDFTDIQLKSLIAHSSQGQRLKPLLSLRYAFRSDEFWRDLDHWKDIDVELFLNHLWQEKNAITSVGALGALIKNRISAAFLRDLEEGHQMAPIDRKSVV